MNDSLLSLVKKGLDERIATVKKTVDFSNIVDKKIKSDITNDIKQAFTFDEKQMNAIIESKIKEGFLKPEMVDENTFKEILCFIETKWDNHKEKIKTFKENAFKKVKNEFITFYKNNFELMIANQYLIELDKQRKSFLEDLYKKMELIAELSRGKNALGHVFGRFWDLSYHELYNLDMGFIDKLYQLLKEKDFIKKIAELLGRLASSNKKLEERIVEEMKFVPNNKKTFYSPSNLIGITNGNNIPDVLPHALALRSRAKTSLIFKKQFAEKQLIQFDKKDKVLDSIKVNRTERVFEEEKKGPFVLVIDTSGSMHGEPESIAKAMSLSFIDIAQRDSRNCFIVNFSTTTTTFDASKISSNWKELHRFLSQSFGGGTDIIPAINAAINQCREKAYKNADVIFISDLIINELGSELRNEVKDLQAKKVRFHALTIGRSYNELATDFFDNNWVYDGSNESINKIISDLYLLDNQPQ